MSLKFKNQMKFTNFALNFVVNLSPNLLLFSLVVVSFMLASTRSRAYKCVTSALLPPRYYYYSTMSKPKISFTCLYCGVCSAYIINVI